MWVDDLSRRQVKAQSKGQLRGWQGHRRLDVVARQDKLIALW